MICHRRQAFVALTGQRVASYWDCYHRRRYPTLIDYPGHGEPKGVSLRGARCQPVMSSLADERSSRFQRSQMSLVWRVAVSTLPSPGIKCRPAYLQIIRSSDEGQDLIL